MKKYIYHVSHFYEDGEYDIETEIGVYTSRIKARRAKRKALEYENIKGHPKSFVVDRYKVNEDNWCEGFFTYR